MMESFWGTLQLELLDSKQWQTRDEPANAIFEWIECWYNPNSRPSSIGNAQPSHLRTPLHQTRPRPLTHTRKLSGERGQALRMLGRRWSVSGGGDFDALIGSAGSAGGSADGTPSDRVGALGDGRFLSPASPAAPGPVRTPTAGPGRRGGARGAPRPVVRNHGRSSRRGVAEPGGSPRASSGYTDHLVAVTATSPTDVWAAGEHTGMGLRRIALSIWLAATDVALERRALGGGGAAEPLDVGVRALQVTWRRCRPTTCGRWAPAATWCCHRRLPSQPAVVAALQRGPMGDGRGAAAAELGGVAGGGRGVTP